jgi:hypothetical protein
MTLQEFEKEFMGLGQEYSMTIGVPLFQDGIRLSHPDFTHPMCPLEAVYHNRTGKVDFYISAAEELGIKKKDRVRITTAADSNDFWGIIQYTEQRLRRMMKQKLMEDRAPH